VNGRLDPPQGGGREPRTAVRLETRGSNHKPEIGLGDEIRKRQTVPPVAARDFCGESQMAGDERIGRVVIPLLLPTSRQLLFLVVFQQLAPPKRLFCYRRSHGSPA
jgi:hypothetical protein